MAGKKQIAIEIQIKNIKQIKVLENQLKKLRKEQRALAKTNEEAKKLSGEEAKLYIRKDAAVRKSAKALRDYKKQLVATNRGQTEAKKSSGSLTKSFIKGAAAVGILISAFRRVNQIVSNMLGIFTSFEFVMAKVQAVSGATDSEFEQLSKTAQELGRSTFFTAEQVGQLQLNYSKLGFTTQEILNAQRATLDLAVATGSDLARAALVAGAAVRGFGLDASETQRVVDVMAVSFSSSAMDMEKWQTSMTKVAPIAKAAGFSIEDTAAIMSKLTDTGIEASIAGTSLRNILLKMQDPSSDLTAVFGHTIHSLDQLLPAMNKFVAEGGDMADIMGVVDIRQAAAFESMISSSDATLELRDSLRAANGEGARMAGIVGDTLHGAWLKYKSAMEGIAIVMMEDLGGALKDILVSIAKWLNALVKNEKQLKKFTKRVKFVTKAILAFVLGILPARIALRAVAAQAVGAGVGMQLFAGATAIASAALKTLKFALVSTGIGVLIVLLGEFIAKMMSANEVVEEAISLQTKFNENFTDTEIQMKKVRKSLESLQKTREAMNKIMEKEGDNLKNNAIENEKYNRLKRQEAIDIRNLNVFNKIYNKDLFTQKTAIDDITTATNTLIKAMKDKALAAVFTDMQAQIIKTKVESEMILKEWGYPIDLNELGQAIEDIENNWKRSFNVFSIDKSLEQQYRQDSKDRLAKMLETYGMTIDDFSQAIKSGYYKDKIKALTEIIESETDFDITELLGLDLKEDEEKDPTAATPPAKYKKAYDERIALLIEMYRTQKEIEITYYNESEQLTVKYTQMELLTEATFAEEKLKAQLKANRDEMAHRILHDDAVEKASGRHGLAMAALAAKQEQILLDLTKHYDSEELKELDRVYTIEQALVNNLLATRQITEVEAKNLLIDLEGRYLTKKLELLTAFSLNTDQINSQILANTIRRHKSEMEMTEDTLSQYGKVGSALTNLAGDNEKLNKVKEIGLAITQAISIAESVLAAYKELTALASAKKTAAQIAENAVELAGLPAKATGVALDSAKGWPFPMNLVAILATLAIIAKVMGMFEKGGVIQEFAEGGMVNGKSHAQGGEKFNVGGRVVELEGGEAVINKRSTSMFRNELSSMNQAGGGVKFADGGLTNLPSFTKTHFDALGQEGMMGAMNQGSRVVVLESDITETQNTVSVIEAQATF